MTSGLKIMHSTNIMKGMKLFFVFLEGKEVDETLIIRIKSQDNSSFQFSLRPLESDKQQQSLLPKPSSSTARQVREYIPRSGMKKYNNALSNLIPIRYQNQYVL